MGAKPPFTAYYEGDVVALLRDRGGWWTTEQVAKRLDINRNAAMDALWAAQADRLIQIEYGRRFRWRYIGPK